MTVESVSCSVVTIGVVVEVRGVRITVPTPTLATSLNNNNNNNSNNTNINNTNNNNHIQRRKSRFFTISSLRREPSPTRTLKWPSRKRVESRAAHRALITCSMSFYVPRDTKGQLRYQV